MSGEVKSNERGGNGGPSTLRKMLRSKYPSLSQKEASKLILKAKEYHGGSLSGMKMGEIIKTIKMLMKEKKSENKSAQVDDQKRKHETTDGDD